MGAVARYPKLSFVGPFRGVPAGYFRAAANVAPAGNTNPMTRVIWMQLNRFAATGVEKYWVDSHSNAQDGWGITLRNTGFRFYVATNAGNGLVSISGVEPGLHVAVLTWDGVDIVCGVRGVGNGTTAHGGAGTGAANPVTIGGLASSPTSDGFSMREGVVGGLIAEQFLLDFGDFNTYMDAVAEALRQDRDVPLPSGGPGVAAQDYYWDARDWLGAGDWTDRVSGAVLPPVGKVERFDVAGVL